MNTHQNEPEIEYNQYPETGLDNISPLELQTQFQLIEIAQTFPFINFSDEEIIHQEEMVANTFGEGSEQWRIIDYFRTQILGDILSESSEIFYINDENGPNFYPVSLEDIDDMPLNELGPDQVDFLYRVALYSLFLCGYATSPLVQANDSGKYPNINLKVLMVLEDHLLENNLKRYVLLGNELRVVECLANHKVLKTIGGDEMTLRKNIWRSRPANASDALAASSHLPIGENEVVYKNATPYVQYNSFNWLRIFKAPMPEDFDLIGELGDNNLLISWKHINEYDDGPQELPLIGYITVVNSKTGHALKEYCFVRELVKKIRQPFKLEGVTEFSYSMDASTGSNITTCTAKRFVPKKNGEFKCTEIDQTDAIYEPAETPSRNAVGPREMNGIVQQRLYRRIGGGWSEVECFDQDLDTGKVTIFRRTNTGEMVEVKTQLTDDYHAELVVAGTKPYKARKLRV
jgi:hypothetical protein